LSTNRVENIGPRPKKRNSGSLRKPGERLLPPKWLVVETSTAWDLSLLPLIQHRKVLALLMKRIKSLKKQSKGINL
jgi:hypothetical protein